MFGRGNREDRPLVRLTLPYPISANRYWRSFLPRGQKHAIVVLSDEAKAYRDAVAKIAIAAGVRPLEDRVHFALWLYPARPQDWAKRAQRDPDGWDDDVRCIDLLNADKVLCDALNGIAWIDDKQIRRAVQERCEPDDRGARVEVEIKALITRKVAPELFEAVA